MNDSRRKRIKEAAALIVHAWGEVLEAIGGLESVALEEEDAFENLSEGLKHTERGQSMEECVEELEKGVATLAGVCETFGKVDWDKMMGKYDVESV